MTQWSQPDMARKCFAPLRDVQWWMSRWVATWRWRGTCKVFGKLSLCIPHHSAQATDTGQRQLKLSEYWVVLMIRSDMIWYDWFISSPTSSFCRFFWRPKAQHPTCFYCFTAARPRRYEGQHDEPQGQSGYGYSQSYGYGSGYGGSSASGHQGWSESWIHVLPAPVPECLNNLYTWEAVPLGSSLVSMFYICLMHFRVWLVAGLWPCKVHWPLPLKVPQSLRDLCVAVSASFLVIWVLPSASKSPTTELISYIF